MRSSAHCLAIKLTLARARGVGVDILHMLAVTQRMLPLSKSSLQRLESILANAKSTARCVLHLDVRGCACLTEATVGCCS